MNFKQLFATSLLSALMVFVLLGIMGVAWDGTYVAAPLDNANISAGAGEIRSGRSETYQRLETEMDFGTFNSDSSAAADTGLGGDTGRLHMGAARIFLAVGSAGTDDCTIDFPAATGMAELDYDGVARLDNGRMCLDTDDNRLYVFEGATDAAPPTGGAWVSLFNPLDYIGSGMIVIRPDNTACPTAWTDVTTSFAGMTIRGALTGANDIPAVTDLGAVASTGRCTGGTQDTGCGATAAEYNDTLDAAEIAAHTHGLTLTDILATGQGSEVDTARKGDTGGLSSPTFTTDASAAGITHYHPFHTVRFCQKD